MKDVRRGFTLIELLVVIAIIAVLAAILFPVFISAKESSKRTKCLSHGRQLADALLSYMGDWNDTFPVQPFVDNYYGPGPTGGSNPEDLMPYDLRVLLAPYCKNKRIWECPSAYGYWGKRYSWSWETGIGLLTWIYLYGDGYRAWDPVGLEGEKLSSISRPSKKSVIFDWFAALGPPWGDYIPHAGGTNLLYADGHVRWHKLKKFAGELYPVGYDKYSP